jgi:hypothetical protein
MQRRVFMNNRESENQPQDKSNVEDFNFIKMIIVVIIAGVILIAGKYFM